MLGLERKKGENREEFLRKLRQGGRKKGKGAWG